MMAGETVLVEERPQAVLNDYGEPVHGRGEPLEIGGVLVAPGATSDLADTSRPGGVSAAYTLYFPKGFGRSLRGARVRVRGEWLDVVGDPRPWLDPAPPGRWDMAVEVSATYG